MTHSIMKWKVFIAVMSLVVSGGSSGQSVYPGQHSGKMKKEIIAPMQVKSCDLKDVRLLPSRFRENMMRDSMWMASIAVSYTHLDVYKRQVAKVNDTTFTVRFYRMGMDNPKRTGDITVKVCYAAKEDAKIRFDFGEGTKRRQGPVVELHADLISFS